jgi:predicted transposase YdaD
MKSDPLFYELFQVRPQIFFELAQITPACPYRFESITVKTTEKRIDGILEPTIPGHPIYFVEVQAKPDEQMYWRTSREISVYFEQRPHLQGTDWYAYVIWLNKADDKGFQKTHIKDNENIPRLLSVHLIDILKKLPNNSLALNILRPLIVDSEAEVRQNITAWVEQIHQTPDLSPEAEQRLLMVMTQFIEEKFKSLSYKELAEMLKLTPFKETASYKEAYFEDLQADFLEMLVQQIETKFKFSQKTLAKLVLKLRQLALDDLKAMFKAIITMKRLKEINVWLDSHLPTPQNTDSSDQT